jgi:hypothetical protein
MVDCYLITHGFKRILCVHGKHKKHEKGWWVLGELGINLQIPMEILSVSFVFSVDKKPLHG